MSAPIQRIPKGPRTIVADDSPAWLDVMVGILEYRCEIVATGCNGFEALKLIQRFKPELAVLDLNMPGRSGLEVARGAIKECPTLWVIISTVEQERTFVDAAAEAGARGYVFKTNIHDDLLAAVDTVAAGGIFFPKNG